MDCFNLRYRITNNDMATIKLKYRSSATDGKDGSLFFQIIHHRQVRRIPTDFHLSEAEWDAAGSTVVIPSGPDTERSKYLSSIKESLNGARQRLSAIVMRLDHDGAPYTVEDVVEAYQTQPAAIHGGLVAFTRRLIEEMKKIGKSAAVKRYRVTLSNILRYTGGNEVRWADITSTFMLGFEEFLTKRGLCRNSTSFYMRNLRAIVNRAVDQDVEVPHNPFKHVYTGVDRTVKRAVSLDVVRMIRDIDLSGHPSLEFARNVFMFAFYTRGMSFVDIAFLRKSDLHDNVLTYSRRKTRQQLCVRIEPETRRIIESFGSNPSPFLLPIITDAAVSHERQYESAYCRVNRNIQKIGKILGLKTKLTLYVARHAWASIAQANNVATSIISRAMGHDSEKTTIIYLQSLDTSSVDKANSDIIRMIDHK